MDEMITQVSKGELDENRHLMGTKRGKALLILMFELASLVDAAPRRCCRFAAAAAQPVTSFSPPKVSRPHEGCLGRAVIIMFIIMIRTISVSYYYYYYYYYH